MYALGVAAAICSCLASLSVMTLSCTDDRCHSGMRGDSAYDKRIVLGIFNAELQPKVLKSVNAIRNAIDHKLLSTSHYFDSKLHNFI